MEVSSRFTADTRKAARANKMIGFGAPGSSTANYVQQAGPLANCGVYAADDVVFVSINGRRRNRIGIETYEAELLLAAEAGVTFVADNWNAREKPYNLGEQELAEWLEQHDYVEEPRGSGTWRPSRG